MKNGGRCLLVFTSLLCVMPLVLGFVSLVRHDVKNISAAEEHFEVSEIPISQTESETEKEEAVAAVADAALGNIYENFLSPYSVALKYNNVYIKNKANVDLDIDSELRAGIGFHIEKNGEPQVLIMHTHTTESYMLNNNDYYTADDKARNLDPAYNMVAVGEVFAKELESAGIATLHSDAVHDYPSYTGSYSRSAVTVKNYLNEYPSIKVVLDLHRDSLSSGNDKVKPVTDIDGKKAAQIMLIAGCENGGVTGHPNWRENLRFAIKYQQTLEVMYPSLARALNFCSCKYNQNLSTGALLIEIGTDGNTLEEAKYSASLAAKALAALLNTLSE